MATTTEKIQTLKCAHGEGHEWTRPAQVGKPPKFCPEHKSADRKVMQRDMERKQAEGIRAIGGNPQAIGLTEQDPARAEALAKAREAAAKAREERKAREAQEAQEHAKNELSRIVSTLPEFEAAYEKALAKANRTNKLEDWHTADAAQSRIIGMITRKRALAEAHRA